MNISALVKPLGRFSLILGLSVIGLPLFAHPSQEAQLNDVLQLKQSSQSPRTLQSKGPARENGMVEQKGEYGVAEWGEFFVAQKGDLQIRMPLNAGEERIREVLRILNNGLDESLITGSWNVQAQESRYIFFEFNQEHNYIVIEKPSPQEDPVVHLGPYTIQDKEIILNNLGIMKITELEERKIQFSFSSNNAPETPIEIQKANPNVAESPQTALLCRTWKLLKVGEQEAAGNDQYADTILFSDAGIYVLTYPNQEQGLAYWQWSDLGEAEFVYSWDFEDYGTIQIQSITSSSLILEEGGIIYEFGLPY